MTKLDNEEMETKKCPYCRYLITSNTVLCAHCGTISPILWEKRITDEWETESSKRDIVYNEYHECGINKYRGLFEAAERVDKLFLSRISVAVNICDIAILHEKFVEHGREYSSYGYEETIVSKVKEGCKWYLFPLEDFYRYIGYDENTITVFEITKGLHDSIISQLKDIEDASIRKRKERDAEWKKEREERENAKKVQYEKDLEEYNRLPRWKRLLKSPPVSESI